jgi:uncharacterized YigZ family protein
MPHCVLRSSCRYLTLARPTQMTTEVKKSKFITTAWPITSASQAMALVESTSDRDASHNCWAYCAGQEYRVSDDGEPAGTAGRPILTAIQAEELDYTLVLVTRFFGGVKLGAGGLVRAYAGAARECLRAAPKEFRRARVLMEISVPYKTLGAIYSALPRVDADKEGEEEYQEDGSVRVRISVFSDKEAAFTSMVQDLTSGLVVPTRVVARLADEQPPAQSS